MLFKYMDAMIKSSHLETKQPKIVLRNEVRLFVI